MMKKLKHVQLFENFNEEIQTIDNIDDFRAFIGNYEREILSGVQGVSDGWNQKITAINKIIDENHIEISDDVYDDEEYEEIINNI